MNDLEEQRLRALVDVMRNPNTDAQTMINCVSEILDMCDPDDVAGLVRPYVDEAQAILTAKSGASDHDH